MVRFQHARRIASHIAPFPQNVTSESSALTYRQRKSECSRLSAGRSIVTTPSAPMLTPRPQTRPASSGNFVPVGRPARLSIITKSLSLPLSLLLPVIFAEGVDVDGSRWQDTPVAPSRAITRSSVTIDASVPRILIPDTGEAGMPACRHFLATQAEGGALLSNAAPPRT